MRLIIGTLAVFSAALLYGWPGCLLFAFVFVVFDLLSERKLV